MGGKQYTNALSVWERVGRATRRQKTQQLGKGTTVQLESHVIPDTVKIIDDVGQTVPETHYKVDTDFDQLTYTADDNIQNAQINYITAPVRHERAERGVEQATSFIDSHLDTTFGGLKRVKEEVYKTSGRDDALILFQNQPVRNVEKVWINENPSEAGEPDWKHKKTWTGYNTGTTVLNSPKTQAQPLQTSTRSTGTS